MTPFTFLRHGAARLRASSRRYLAAFGLLAVLTADTSHAAQKAQSKEVGTFRITSNINDVEVVDHTAYVAGGDDGLLFLDTSDISHPTLIGSLDTEGQTLAVQVIGNRAYIADSGSFGIVDIADLKAPKLLGSYSPGAYIVESRVVGDRAYVACAEAGLHILDISDPTNIVKLGEYMHPDHPFDYGAYALRVVGNTAFIAYNSLEIVDVSDPTSPKRISTWDKGAVADVEVVGDLAYVAAASDGLIVFDIHDLTSPKRLTRIPPPGFCISVQLAGQRAYTSSGIYDVSDPVSPVLLEQYNYIAYAAQIFVQNDLVFFPTGLGDLKILKVRFGSPQTLDWGGLANVIPPSNTPTPLDIHASSGLPLQLEVVTGPATIQNKQLTVTGPGKVIVKATQEGDAAYLSVEETRLLNQIYANVDDLSTFGFQTNIFGARVAGNRAYVGADVFGLRILDVSNPSKPVPLGVVPGTNEVFEAQIDGSYAYVADGEGGLKIADVSNPADPTVVATLPGKLVIAVTLAGKYAYIADLGAREFVIADISNPADPKRIGSVSVKGEPRFTRIIGNRAYFAAGSGGVLIYDISNPAEPALVSSAYKGATVRGVDVVGDTLFVPEYGQGQLVALNISNPSSPVELGRLFVGGYSRRVLVENGVAFLTGEYTGLHLIDVADPAHMVVMSLSPTGDGARDIQKIGNMIYVADQNTGLRIFELKEIGFKPSINFHPAASLAYGQALPLSGTSSHAQPVQFEVVAGPGTLQQGKLVPTGLGLITVRAKVPATAGYLSQTLDEVVVSTVPALSIQKKDGGLDLSWPTGLAHTALEQTASLQGNPVWQPLPALIQESAGLDHAALSAEGASGFVRLSTPYPGFPQPLQLTGWNRDVVLENAPSPVAQAFDLEGSAWFEDGLEGYFNGLPKGGGIVDQNDPNLVFQLQPYTSDNVLWLDPGQSSGTLKLGSPKAYSRIYVLAAAPWERPTGGTVIVKYTDGTTSEPKPFSAHYTGGVNFFGELYPTVFPGVGRSFSADEFNYVRGQFGFHMYQTTIDLGTGAQSGKPIDSLQFQRVDEDGYIVGVFAVSGIAVPSVP